MVIIEYDYEDGNKLSIVSGTARENEGDGSKCITSLAMLPWQQCCNGYNLVSLSVVGKIGIPFFLFLVAGRVGDI